MNTPTPSSLELDNLDQLEHWINSLKKLNVSVAGSELHQFLQRLRQNPPAPLTKFAILDRLSGPTQYYADQLETLVLSESIQSKPLAVKTAKLSSQLLISLNLNYCQIYSSTDLDPQQQHTALYLAFQLIGLSLRKQAVFKQCPSSKLWKKNAELYQFALKSQLLTQPLPKLTHFKVIQKNLSELLQRNLLFSICYPYHFQSNTVSHLFKFAERHFALLRIDSPEPLAGFMWIPDQAVPPRPYSTTYSPAPNAIFLNCEAVIKQLDIDDSFNFTKPELSFLQQHLSGFREIIDSIIPSAPKQYQLIINNPQIHWHLNQHTAMNNIRRITSESKGSDKLQPLLQLEPLNTPPPLSNQKSNASQSKDQLSIAVYNTRLNNFVLASVAQVSLRIDQPVLLIKSFETMTLGFIKQAIQNSTQNSQNFLIELERGQIESVNLSIGKESIQAILIKQTSANLEVLLPPANYQSNTKVESNSKTLTGEYCIDKLLEITEFFMRFQLIAY